MSSFVSGAAPQLPSEQVLFIHADKVTYSWGLTQKSLIDWEAQIAYFTIWGIADAFTLRRLRESKEEERLSDFLGHCMVTFLNFSLICVFKNT